MQRTEGVTRHEWELSARQRRPYDHGVPSETHVSVHVASYERRETLELALQSILRQTHQNFGVLVWNDGGVDMRGLVPSLEDPRVRYHQHPENLGLAQAVALGLRSAPGEYLAYVDDDDVWEPEFLSTLATALDGHPSAALAFCDIWIIREDGSRDPIASDADGSHWGRVGLRAGLHQPAVQLVLDGAVPTASGAVFRRAALDLDDFPPSLAYAPDRWIAYLATKNGQGVYYEPQRLASKRRHAGQMGGALASLANLRDMTILYERALADRGGMVDRRSLTGNLAVTWANTAVACVRTGATHDARAAASRSLEARRSARGAVAWLLARTPPRIGRPAARAISDLIASYRRRFRADVVGGRV